MQRVLLLSILSLLAASGAAQDSSRSLLLRGPAFASWTGDMGPVTISPDAVRMPASSGRRARNALLGGAIGAAAGAVVCTAISNIADDAAVDRLTTCTWKGYALLGSLGFGAGLLVGWIGSS